MATNARRRELVAIPDAAAYFGVTPLTIRNWVAAGTLKAYRIGPRVIRIDLAEADSLLQPIPTARNGAA